MANNTKLAAAYAEHLVARAAAEGVAHGAVIVLLVDGDNGVHLDGAMRCGSDVDGPLGELILELAHRLGGAAEEASRLFAAEVGCDLIETPKPNPPGRTSRGRVH